MEKKKAEYHEEVDKHAMIINENLKSIFEYSQIQDKVENEKAANLQIKTSNLIIMQSINELFLLLQKIKHHSTRFNNNHI